MAKPIKPLQTTERLSWTHNPREVSERPRVFRLHRMSAFEWQAFCIVENTEYAIGKPDVFEILIRHIAKEMRNEGQREFLTKNHAATAKAAGNA